jgi:hypothetical protein
MKNVSIKLKLLTPILLFILIKSSFAQIIPPCGNDYGSSSDETNISYQMRYGTIPDAVSAINQAKSTRGSALGCPQTELSYNMPSTMEPSLNEIINAWNSVASEISNFEAECPRIARYENNLALGAYYAMQAGYFTDTAALAIIGEMMYAQQYADWNIASPDPRNEGVFGYIHVDEINPCYPGGVVGESVETLCNALPQYCVTYTNGMFAGASFAISGQDDANNWFDGSLAYDHGWAGVQMIEASLLQDDPILREKFLQSALLAGQYAISEHCVKNHNYTSKLIWLLAELYALTGEEIYKTDLNYKLEKNLIPGILLDENDDGIVDETNPPAYFSQLYSPAATPGRMWDAHNSLPWYHAMNAWAMVEAYVAFRDRGDTQRAAELKPYAIAMIDNLAREILYQGVVTPNQLGIRDITYALQIAVWKIAMYENEAHDNWESAMWAMWNTGYFEDVSTHSICTGLFLLIKSGTDYVPLHLRETSNVDFHFANNSVRIYPNPTRDCFNIDANYNVEVKNVYDCSGRSIEFSRIGNQIILLKPTNGLYFVEVYDGFLFHYIKLNIF